MADMDMQAQMEQRRREEYSPQGSKGNRTKDGNEAAPGKKTFGKKRGAHMHSAGTLDQMRKPQTLEETLYAYHKAAHNHSRAVNEEEQLEQSNGVLKEKAASGMVKGAILGGLGDGGKSTLAAVLKTAQPKEKGASVQEVVSEFDGNYEEIPLPEEAQKAVSSAEQIERDAARQQQSGMDYE